MWQLHITIAFQTQSRVDSSTKLPWPPQVKKPKQGRLDADAKRLPTFGVYDLQALGVPQEAWPIEGKEYKGQKGYTVVSDSGAALWMTALKLLYTCFYPVHLELWVFDRLCPNSLK